MTVLRYHDRFDYSGIVDRPAYEWPEGKRLAVYIAINVEHWPFGEGEGAQLTGGEPPPNVRAYTWRDYGNRVGIWNLLELFEELRLPAVINLNTGIYGYCPRILEPWRARGDEVVAHGRTNGERQVSFREPDERRLIEEVTEAIARHEGRRPEGWLGPYFSQSRVTPDLLKEAGYAYTLDWHNDDQPYWMRTRSGPLLSVPYPHETNDSPAIQHRMAQAGEFADQIVDEFEEMLRMSAARPLVCPIALHHFIVGRPFRILHLRRALRHIRDRADKVWLTRSGEIARHVAGLPEGVLPR